WYPHTAGHRTMVHMLRPHEPNLLRTLRREGYFVWWGGKNDLVPGQGGFDDVADLKFRHGEVDPDPHRLMMERYSPDDADYYSMFWGKLTAPGGRPWRSADQAYVDGACDFLRHRPADRPLVIYLPLQYPHPPYAVEEPFFSMIDRAKLPPRTPAPPGWRGKPSLLRGIAERQHLGHWTEEQWTELRAVYLGMCARVDRQFGQVCDTLRETGLWDDTAVFLFSDHGDFTGDYGLVEKTQNTFEDCLTRVPLLVKPPAGVPVRPRVSEALVELIDAPATIEALCGLVPRHTHFGRSLLPVLAGHTDEHRDAVFCEGGRLAGEEHCREGSSSSSRDPKGLYWPRVGLQQRETGEHTKAAMCRTRRWKYVRRRYEEDELYDLAGDPCELDNRIADPSLAGELAALKDRMLTWYQETCDAVPHDIDQR
ncbi:MAG TPA: sulfatase-like hydrolase/transferase, partial [Vicinamibacterales bacterium]|nr:sulfatase-like hydrolase/transferase [Vicinamibacterales bacterium]